MTLQRKDNVLARRIVGETLLVPIRGNMADMQKVFVLEGIGEFVWDRLDGRKTMAQIEGEVAAEFAVAPETARTDVDEFARQLTEAGLVEEKA